MTTPTRYRLGRKPNSGRPRIRLTAAHVSPAYTPPLTLDRFTAVSSESWGMDGNGPDPSNPPDVPDGAGDCTCADVDHELKSAQVAAGNTETVSTATEVLAAYSAITGYDPADPNSDQGAEMQTVREFWQKTGFTLGGADHKVLLFAELDVHDITVSQWALDQFGAVGVGVNLPQSAMDQFDAGQSWDVVADDGGILGGHAVAYVGYNAVGPVFVSWGKVVQATWAWWHAYVEEAWGVLTEDFVNAHTGQDPLAQTLYQMGVEFQALTGKPNPVPAPVPSPTPPPGPTPTPVPPAPQPTPSQSNEALALVARPWVAGHHVGDNHRMAVALKTWLTDNNFSFPEPEGVIVHFVGGPWHDKDVTISRATAPVFAAGHEIGNRYWLNVKGGEGKPTYYWDAKREPESA